QEILPSHLLEELHGVAEQVAQHLADPHAVAQEAAGGCRAPLQPHGHAPSPWPSALSPRIPWLMRCYSPTA
ncbi:hypothetical protein, partial [Providencia stuartii]|uniref:hypothetical protein n=1 Tax=Providencia stuartii TaxID=588 RepID=UPI0019536802